MNSLSVIRQSPPLPFAALPRHTWGELRGVEASQACQKGSHVLDDGAPYPELQAVPQGDVCPSGSDSSRCAHSRPVEQRHGEAPERLCPTQPRWAGARQSPLQPRGSAACPQERVGSAGWEMREKWQSSKRLRGTKPT